MSYRDDLAAAQAQNQALRLEVAHKALEIDRLSGRANQRPGAEGGATGAREGKARKSNAPARGGIRFVRPSSFFPLLTRWRHAMRRAFAWRSSLSLAPSQSDTVAVWLAYKLLAPMLILTRALALIVIVTVVIPVTAINTIFYSLALLPLWLISSFRFSNAQAKQIEHWSDSLADDDEDDDMFLFLMLMPPLVFPGLFIILALIVALA